MNSQQTTLFLSEELVVYGKCIHAASIITQKVDLKRIKLEMNAINERQDNMTDESQHEEHMLMPFMRNIEQSYHEMWNQQSTAFLDQSKQQ